MKNKYNGKLKIILVFGILFLLIAVLLMLIFLEGKKTYTVRFELDGGTLLGGSLEQRIMQGQDAIPPSVVKDGAYLRGWSSSYRRITKDVVIEAVWEYETTSGIIYSDSENQNYVEIERAYPFLRGEVYLGAYFNEKKVLGILPGAFADCKGVTKVYLLDGLITIGRGAFENCTSLSEIEIPETVTHVGKYAFKGCESLEEVILQEGILGIGENAFEGCIGLTEVILPESLTTIEANAFAGCTDLVIKTTLPKEEWPQGWAEGWFGDATVEIVEPEEEDEELEDSKENDKNKDKEKESRRS